MPIVEVKQFGGPEALELIDQPDPVPGEGQLTVQVKAAGINFADVSARAGRYRGVPSAPFFPGFETAGVVREVGAGVSGFTAGDRVIGVLQGGGYASVTVIDAKSAVKIPDSLDFGPASALLIQGLTAYFLLEHGGVGPGKTVLISSASGGLGSLAVQMAKLKGSTVIGLASLGKHDRVKGLGADAVINYTQPGWGKDVLSAAGEKGVDLYLDSSGDLAGEGFDTLGYGARWLIYGGQASSGHDLTPSQLGAMVGKNITLRGYNVYFDYANFGRALTDLIGWATSGKLRIDVESFPLADVAKAHMAIEARKTSGKVVLVP